MRRTTTFTKFLAGALALGICGIADAKTPTTPTKKTGVHGVIMSVQKDTQGSYGQITVKTSGKKGSEQTVNVTITSSTTIQVKRNTKSAASKTATASTASFSSLHPGDRVLIEPSADAPTTIVDLGAAKKERPRKV